MYLYVIMVNCIMYVYDMFKYFFDVFLCADCTQGFGLQIFFVLTYSVACVHRVFRAVNKAGFSTEAECPHLSLVRCSN